jgi:hypothetical protein
LSNSACTFLISSPTPSNVESFILASARSEVVSRANSLYYPAYSACVLARESHPSCLDTDTIATDATLVQPKTTWHPSITAPPPYPALTAPSKILINPTALPNTTAVMRHVSDLPEKLLAAASRSHLLRRAWPVHSLKRESGQPLRLT